VSDTGERHPGRLVLVATPIGNLGDLAPRAREVLEAAILVGGATLRDHRQTDGSLGYFQHSFAVYNREGTVCGHARCTGLIQRTVQSGRSTFYCAVCQR